jgi:hypothetical protein
MFFWKTYPTKILKRVGYVFWKTYFETWLSAAQKHVTMSSLVPQQATHAALIAAMESELGAQNCTLEPRSLATRFVLERSLRFSEPEFCERRIQSNPSGLFFSPDSNHRLFEEGSSKTAPENATTAAAATATKAFVENALRRADIRSPNHVLFVKAGWQAFFFGNS